MNTSPDTVYVLHVDDEPDFADLTATFLERKKEWFTVETETSASEGLDRLDNEEFDCVVSDYNMPGMNGIEFLEHVRETYPDLPFILFTGKGSEEVASDAITAGATDYLQKGSGSDQYTVLANRLQNAVAQFRSQRRANEHQRISEVVRNLNRALVRAKSVDEIEEEVCAILSDADPYLTACIAEVNADTMQIEPRTWAGDDAGYFEALEMSVADDAPGRHAPGGQAYHDREIAILQSIPDDPKYEEWRDAATERGFQSLAVVPLEYNDDLYGLLAVFADRRYAFDETEQELLTELGDDIAHAMEARQTRSALQTRSRAMDEAPVGITISDPDKPDNPLVYVNNEFAELTGYSGDEVFGENCRFLQGPKTAEEPVAAMREAINNEERVTAELRNYRKNDEQFWNRVSIAPVYNEEGSLTNYVGFQQDVTAEKEREQQLQQKERRYQAVFNDPNILVGLIDTDGTVLDINQTAMEYVTASQDEIIGTPFWKTSWFDHSGEVQQEVRKWIDRAVGGEYVEFEADLIRPDGDPYTIEGVFRPVTNDDGEVVSLVISDRDITERKQRERELEQYEAYLEGSNDIITVLDDDGTVQYQSPSVTRILGYEQGKLLGTNGFSLVHPDDRDELVERFSSLIADPSETVTAEARFQAADGEWRWLEVRGTNYLDHPLINGVVTNNRDITERKQRENRLEALNHTARELMAADTREKVAERGVEAASEILGLDASAIHLYDETRDGLVPIAQSEKSNEIIGDAPVFKSNDSIAWRVYENGRPLAVDDVHDDPDIYNPDSPVRSELILPVGDEGILIAGSQSPAAFDTEDLVLGEILARTIATALEQVTRTEQLRSREQELMRQNDRLEEFASVVSHDLQNPLQVAEGRLELVKEDCENEQLDDIERALNRMGALIEDLLTLAREGEQVQDQEPVNIADLTRNCWQNIETTTATLHVETDTTIRADRSRLQQLLENLIRNAIDHGGDEVTITIGDIDTGFYVADDGPGVPLDERESIFEAGNSTSQEGTGFGLSIVQEISSAHEWDITITDSIEGGARFEITGCEGI